MSKAERDEQIDEDIAECKADVLRAHDITPPYKKETKPEPKTQETNENATGSGTSTEMAPEKQETARRDTTEAQTESAATQQEKTGIPRFDLAEEIMAEQRKISAVRRKAPGKGKEPQSQEPKAELIAYSVAQPAPGQPYEDKIIAEIVTRDIERLYRGNNPANSK